MSASLAKHVSKKLGIEALAARFDALETEVRELRAALLFEIARNKDLASEVRASAALELMAKHDLANRLTEQTEQPKKRARQKSAR